METPRSNSAPRAPPLEAQVFLGWPLLPVLFLCTLLLMFGARVERGGEIRAGELSAGLIMAGLMVLPPLAARALGLRSLPGVGTLVLLISGWGFLARTRMEGADGLSLATLSFWLLPAGWLVWVAVWALLRKGRVEVMRSWYAAAGVIGLLLLGALLAMGTRYRGAVFGPGNITPTELLKFLAPLCWAGLLARGRKGLQDGGLSAVRALIPSFIFWALLGVLLIVQRDLGMWVMLSATFGGMVCLATRRLSWLFAALLAAVGMLWGLARFFPHGGRRIEAWLDPFADPTGTGWQTLQALTAMFSGGFWGIGFGAGAPERVPIVHSDFVYVIIAEEFGWTGCVLLVLAFIGLFRLAPLLYAMHGNSFLGLASLGWLLSLSVQTLVNLGGVVKLLPITGVPLPLVSAGGSSLLVTLTLLGLIMAASDSSPKKTTPTRKRKEIEHEKPRRRPRRRTTKAGQG
jgi:cell division protein FtsW (lipid II flippase)